MDKEELPSLPAIELFRGKALRSTVEAALSELDSDEWYRTGEILEHIDTGRESIRPLLVGENGDRHGDLVKYGILDVRNPEVKIPHYQVANSDVMEVLYEWDEMPLPELFEYPGRQRLVNFFIAVADPDKTYSINRITQPTPLGYTAVNKHIDTLVHIELVEVVEGKRGDEYRIDTDSSIYTALRELNDTIYETVQKRQQTIE